MEFPARHIEERHQQFTEMQEDLPLRYAQLKMQYEALHQEILEIITPPPSERLITQCKFGISIGAYFLVKKFEYQQPIQVIAKSGLSVLAFCWAHVCRDFLNYSKEHPNNESFGLLWVDRINHLYHVNNQRIQHNPKSKEFERLDQELRSALSEMKKTAEEEINKNELLPSAKKLLISLNKHWSGLTVFVDDYEIPMGQQHSRERIAWKCCWKKKLLWISVDLVC